MGATFWPCTVCPAQCGPVFDRVVVSYVVAGGTRVMWTLLPTFTDPPPYTFRLEVGQTADNNAGDWEPVGGPVENAFFAVDPDQRVWGKTNWTHYRVRLSTALGEYVSEPTGGKGTLSRVDWLRARNMARFERNRMRLGAGQDGYLLKRRVTGQKCRVCLDRATDEVRDPDCPSCYGTGFECGYFYPVSCVWADFSPKARRTDLDAGQSRGTVDDVVVQARMIATDLMEEDDVWVNRVTDDRYYVHRVTNLAEVRGVPVIANVEMRPIPFSSVVYSIEIPAQVRSALAATGEA